MQIKIFTKEEANVSYKDLVELIHDSFQERLSQGLKYTTSFMTKEEYIDKTKDGVIFVAIDNDTNALVGTGTLNLLVDKTGSKYGYIEFDAIKERYKRKGIGTMLMKNRIEYAQKLGCNYLLSDTSVNADSAVRYHLKNGFRIIGLESYSSTNYYSYIFRKQLTPSFFWCNSILVKIHYFCSFLLIKATKSKRGKCNWLGKQIKKICKN